MHVFQNLSALENQFDTFIFDAYGVFYDGAAFYAGVLDYMEHLINEKKQVVVLSNSSQVAAKNMESYRQKGLIFGRHYSLFVTSGQVFTEAVRAYDLPVVGRRYYMIGHADEAFRETEGYTRVSDPRLADFAFLSIPYLTADEVKAFEGDKSVFLPAKVGERGEVLYWDTTRIEPFLPIIEKCVRLGLPALVANPDFYASEKHIGSAEVTFVVRNGLLAEYYRRAGGTVFEYGKPNRQVYDYVASHTNRTDAARTAMIGDTIRTDIRGAANVGIVPILCLETGVTAHELKNGARLDELLKASEIHEKQLYFIRRVV